MIRIGQLIEDVGARHGGTTSAFLSVVDALARLPGDVSVVAYAARPGPDDPSWRRIDELATVTWRLTTRARRLFAGELARTVARDASLGRIDVLQIHGVWSADLVAAAKACRRRRIPVLWTPHGMLLRDAVAAKSLKKQLFLRLGLARELREAAGFVYASSGEMRDTVLPEGSPGESGVPLGLPVDVPGSGEAAVERRRLARIHFGVGESDRVIGFLGRLHHVKRVELLLDAFARVRNSRASARLLLLGEGEPGYVATLRQRVAAAGLSESVVFAGWVAGEDKWRALAAIDLAVLCSAHENFGYGAVEPLAAGAPVVITGNLSLAPDLSDAGVGVVVDDSATDPVVALAEGIEAVLARPDREELGRRGQEWVRTRYAPENLARRLRDLCRAVRMAAGPAMPRS